MIIKQINPPLNVETVFGAGMAHFIWCDGPDTVVWGVFQNETGEMWWWQNHEIRLSTDLTEGRFNISPIVPSKDKMEALKHHFKRYKEHPPLPGGQPLE